MRTVLVTGDRNWSLDNACQAEVIENLMKNYYEVGQPVRIVHGAARGVDSMADYYAVEYSLEVVRYPAEWDQYGRAAGPIRNRQMLDEKPNLVVAFHDDLRASKGTKDMVNQALKAGITVVHIMSDGTRERVKERVK
jgi:SLOG family YspA-like protein